MEETLRACGQEHVLSQVPDLSSSNVLQQLLKFDVTQSVQRFHRAVAAEASSSSSSSSSSPSESSSIESLTSTMIWSQLPSERQEHLSSLGWQALSQGKVAAVIMSGGQGTRLGFAGPKGMYDLGLPSGRTIFHLHMDRLAKVRRLAHTFAPTAAAAAAASASIPVYIMTSDLNDATIRAFFQQHDYFGYPAEDVFFFEQGLEPCFSLDGKVIFDGPDSLSMAPDGNGGIYSALQTSGALADMARRGIEHLHIFGIDNVLTKSLDPGFIGAAIESGAQCANKVVPRAHAGEKVGVTAMRQGRMCVVEYSELPPLQAGSSDAEGRLVFGAANICNHYLSLAFLRDVVLPCLAGSGDASTYHVARKKIPYHDRATSTLVTPTAVNGIKLELFIFDVFPLADRWLVLEVAREDEFAPVKNEPGNASDSPDTARALMHAQAVRWLAAVGCHVWEAPAAGGDGGVFGDAAACEELRGSVAASGDAGGAGGVGGAGEAGPSISSVGELPPPPQRHRSITQSIDLVVAPAAAATAASAAGAERRSEPVVEISALLSYAGEGLGGLAGAVVRPPCFLE